MSVQGWIKLHRKTIEWEWYQDHSAFRDFMHLLLTCSRREKRFRGFDVPAGSVVTGRKKLSTDTGLSEQNVRTSLKKLKSTNEITIETTKDFSIISVVNWVSYQEANQQDNQQLTSNQPAANQQLTTIQEGKEYKERKKEESVVVLRERETGNSKTLLEEITDLLEIDVSRNQSWFIRGDIISELELTHGRDTVLEAARRARISAEQSGKPIGSPAYLRSICQAIEAERARPVPSRQGYSTGSPASGPADETPEQTIARLKKLGLLNDDDDDEEAHHG